MGKCPTLITVVQIIHKITTPSCFPEIKVRRKRRSVQFVGQATGRSLRPCIPIQCNQQGGVPQRRRQDVECAGDRPLCLQVSTVQLNPGKLPETNLDNHHFMNCTRFRKKSP